MARTRKTLTTQQKKARKAAKEKRKRQYRTVFLHGKQVRVKREPTVDGVPVEQFVRENADPIWLHQHGLWELLDDGEPLSDADESAQRDRNDDGDAIPF